MLTLDIDSLKLNKFNDRAIPEDYEEVYYEEIIEDESTINFFKNQAIALNSNLAVCFFIFYFLFFNYIYVFNYNY